MNRATNQYLNTGFDRGLSLLSQGLTGYDWAPRRDLNHGAVKHYTKVGRQLRAQAFGQALRGLSQAIVGAFGRAARAFQHGRVRRASIRELSALSDHQLKDIGLFRAEIPAAVDKLLRNQSQPAVEPKSKVVTIPETKDAANDETSKLAA
jgi:uncharacterized protein YjiS (DUF1127 family)